MKKRFPVLCAGLELQNEAENRQLPDFKFKVDTSLVGEPVQACPVCNDPWIHLQAVEVEQGRQLTTHTKGEATTTTKPDQKPRGSIVVIRFIGECGHKFAYRWQFHKGTTYVELCDVGPGSVEHTPTMWRG